MPRLDGSASWLACRAERLVNGGDHVVVLGRVIAVRHDPAPPLTYCQHAFGTHRPHRTEAPRPTLPLESTEPLPALPVPHPAFAFDSLEEWFAFT